MHHFTNAIDGSLIHDQSHFSPKLAVFDDKSSEFSMTPYVTLNSPPK